LSLLLGIAITFLCFRQKKTLTRAYAQFVEGQRKMAKVKKEIEKKQFREGTVTLSGESGEQKRRQLVMGLFSAHVEAIKGNEDEISQFKREEKMIKHYNISFFKVPTLYFDHMRRLRVNSFKEFLEDMLESPKHFTNTKMENEEFFKAVSINQSQLIDIYYSYCTKKGYRPRPIDEELNLLQMYKLERVYKIDKSTVAYTNLRWKKPAEKESNVKKDIQEELEDESSVKLFLEEECVSSKFPQDMILAPELTKKFENVSLFCVT
jgi:hypothetical protein